MPHSVFTGRVQQPGEPYFLRQDTDLAIALAEEERDTCPSCGLPKAWCRDVDNQFAFEAHEEQCHVTYTLAARRNAVAEGRSEEVRAAIQTTARFIKGKEPDLAAGLDLPAGAAEFD